MTTSGCLAAFLPPSTALYPLSVYNFVISEDAYARSFLKTSVSDFTPFIDTTLPMTGFSGFRNPENDFWRRGTRVKHAVLCCANILSHSHSLPLSTNFTKSQNSAPPAGLPPPPPSPAAILIPLYFANAQMHTSKDQFPTSNVGRRIFWLPIFTVQRSTCNRQLSTSNI